MIIVGVSGGVDSMVLLDMLLKENYKIIVAHVNYQKRNDSKQDELVIKEYLKNKDVIFEKYVVDKSEYTNDNFQKQARDIRYKFYGEIAKKYQCDEVYLAHHKDDYLETYLFKKRRSGIYDYYGIKENTIINKLKIKRPLLSMYKDEIYQYAKDNDIKYHEDSSNFELDYTRNIIREELNNLDEKEKNEIYQQAVNLNDKLIDEIKAVSEIKGDYLSVKKFNEYSLNIKRRYLYSRFNKYDISIKHLDEIIRKISESKRFQETILYTTIDVSYDNIYLLDTLKINYNILIENKKDLDDFNKKLIDKYGCYFEDCYDDYPYVIINHCKKDLDVLDKKKIVRKMKNNKIPKFLRDCFGVIVKDECVVKELIFNKIEVD